VRAVAVQQNARPIVKIAGVSADVVAAFDHQTGLAQLGTQTLCQHRPGEPRACYQKVEFFRHEYS